MNTIPECNIQTSYSRFNLALHQSYFIKHDVSFTLDLIQRRMILKNLIIVDFYSKLDLISMKFWLGFLVLLISPQLNYRDIFKVERFA